jgi:RimJ/RimL family protein N-acetyltransferase
MDNVWHAAEWTDKAQILAYLETDRLYAAYAIGDLEAQMFEQSRWAGAWQAGQPRALVLYFGGLAIPALLMMGAPGGLRAILRSVLCPPRVYLTLRTPHLPVARESYAWERLTPMWRMAIEHTRFHPVAGPVIPLTSAQAEELLALYAHGGGGAFDPAQMRDRTFYGVRVDGQLVAAAGTHLVSPTYGVAALGNVFTLPAHRGRGYATAAASAVVAELLRRGIHDVILNVSQANERAVRVYERLGFGRYCPYLEGVATARVRT